MPKGEEEGEATTGQIDRPTWVAPSSTEQMSCHTIERQQTEKERWCVSIEHSVARYDVCYGYTLAYTALSSFPPSRLDSLV